jgi:hypothetical protein
VARRSEPKERGRKPCVSNPRCSLRGRLTCGWHSATGEQSASSRQTAAEQRAARRSATSCSPRQPFRRLIRADREWPATLRRPWRPECHLRRTCGAETRRQRGHQPAEARSSEERGAPVRCAAPAQCYCARRITGASTAPGRPLYWPPDRPGALRGGSGRCTSAVSRCVGATGRLQRGARPKVSLCPERSVDGWSLCGMAVLAASAPC